MSSTGKSPRRMSELEMWQSRVDKMIDTQQIPGVRKIGPVIQVACFKSDLPFALEFEGQLHYRGFILQPTAKRTPSKRKHVSATQVDIEAATLYRGK